MSRALSVRQITEKHFGKQRFFTMGQLVASHFGEPQPINALLRFALSEKPKRKRNGILQVYGD